MFIVTEYAALKDCFENVNIIKRLTLKYMADSICFSLTLYAQMASSYWFDTINLGWCIVLIEGSLVIFSKYNHSPFSEDYFVLENNEDTDEIPQYRDSDQIPIPLGTRNCECKF